MNNAHKSNVEFYRTCSPDLSADLESHLIVSIQTVQTIYVCEDFYCNYGTLLFFGSLLIELYCVY